MYGDAMVTGTLTASAFAGGCISSALNSTSVTTAASASALASVYALSGNALPLTGGTISGALTVIGQLNASNMAVLGDFVTIRSYETHSSNIVIDNVGTGPALKVTQTEGGPLGSQPVAEFYNGLGVAALFIDNNGNVAVNQPTASAELDVSGVCKATSFQGNGSGLTGIVVATQAWDVSGTNVTVPSGKHVGIGKTNPGAMGYALDISGGLSAYFLDTETLNVVNGTLSVASATNTNTNKILFADQTNGTIFAVQQFDVINTSGYMSIGRNGCLDLTVAGAFNGLAWTDSTTHIGIGTSPSLSHALDVSGSAHVSRSLDVSGNVNVDGTIFAGNVGLRYWQVIGTTSSWSSGGAAYVIYALPTACTFSSIVGFYGVIATTSTEWDPISAQGSTANAYMYISNVSNNKLLAIWVQSTAYSAKPFSVIITTTS